MQCVGVLKGGVCCVWLPHATGGLVGVVAQGVQEGALLHGALSERHVRVKIPDVEVHKQTHGYESNEGYRKGMCRKMVMELYTWM